MWRFTLCAKPLGSLVTDVGINFVPKNVPAAPGDDPLTPAMAVKLHARDGASDPLGCGRIVGQAALFPDPARVTLNRGLNNYQ